MFWKIKKVFPNILAKINILVTIVTKSFKR